MILKSQISPFWVIPVQNFQMTQGGLPSLAGPRAAAVPPFEFLLHVQGYHYYKEQLPFDSIKLEQKAAFQAEPKNEFDPNAIKVLIDGIHVGHVCRGLTKSFHKWFDMGYKIDASIERKNGTSQRPELYLYVSIKLSS